MKPTIEKPKLQRDKKKSMRVISRTSQSSWAYSIPEGQLKVQKIGKSLNTVKDPRFVS